MSQIVVSSITTHNNTTPLYITTGNNTVGMDMHAANGAINIKGTEIRKNGTILGAGKQTMWIPAAAFTARLTNGPALNQTVMSANTNNYKTYDFDPATNEYLEMHIRMPKSWDKGTISYAPVWSQLTTSAGQTVWFLGGHCYGAGDSISYAYTSFANVTSSGGTANINYIGAESSSFAPTGSPQNGDILALLLLRGADQGADTLAIDARLHGINIYYTANTDSDAESE